MYNLRYGYEVKMISLEKFFKISNIRKLINNNDKILVAFSGGPDSVFLAEILKFFQREIHFTFSLAHVNHMLRGESANNDEQFSIKYGMDNNLEVFTAQYDITKLAKEEKMTFEEVGRIKRYEFFHKLSKEHNFNKIALAHNKDDQIETFLFRLIRGTSLDGLEGIRSWGQYIRPISHLFKKEIIDYLEKNNIKYCVDKSNLQCDYTRNSIRLELIPFIEKKYNSQFREKIYSLIEEIRESNSHTGINLGDYLDESGKKLFLSSVLMESQIIQKKIIKEYIYRSIPHSYERKIELSRRKIENIQNIILKNGEKKIDINKDYILFKDYLYLTIENKILLTKEKLLKKNYDVIDLIVPGKIKLGNYTIEAKTYEVENTNLEFLDLKDERIFYTNIKEKEIISIRYRRNGDRIIPMGVNFQKKIKEIFIDKKIHKEKRDKIPIITYKEDIVWVVGIKKSEVFKYTKEKEEKSINIENRRDLKNIKLTIKEDVNG